MQMRLLGIQRLSVYLPLMTYIFEDNGPEENKNNGEKTHFEQKIKSLNLL